MLESIFNKAAGLKVCNSIKKRLQHSCLPVKLAKFLKTPFFTEEFRWLLLTFNSCLHRSSGQKQVWLSAINTRFSWKMYLRPQKSRSSQRRCSVKEGMQRPAQVFSCEYCEIFKNTYFEKHLWTAASENQDFSDKFTKGRYLKSFNFAMMECFFLSSLFLSWKGTHQVRCYHFFIVEINNESVNLNRKLLSSSWRTIRFL